MVCHHLSWLEQRLLASGVRETFRGQAWSSQCREWVYFDVWLDLKALAQEHRWPECVVEHQNDDPKSGLERGLVCRSCHDAIMGRVTQERIFPSPQS